MMNRLYGYIYRARINSHAANGSARIKAKLLDLLYRQLSSIVDPLVTFEINGFPMRMPFSHKLPFYLKEFPGYCANLARITKITRNKYPDFTLIDVGANIGDSLALLRKIGDFPVLCIEGDELFFGILKRNAGQFANVKLLRAYAGEENTCLSAAAKRHDGTAHLSDTPQEDPLVRIGRLPDLIGPDQRFIDPRMIKIDTDGYDCKVIRGAADLLARAKPVLFFEYDPSFLAEHNDDGISIFRQLSDIGYEQMLVYDNFGKFLFSLRTAQESLIRDLHNEFSGHQGKKYCDICVFHRRDNDIFAAAKEREVGAASCIL